MSVHVDKSGYFWTVTIDNPENRNAVDRETADALSLAFKEFDSDDSARVGVLTEAGGTFCSGANLKAMSSSKANRLDIEGDGPMGPTRMELTKPIIAAIEGFAVAGGLELSLWCDLRVASKDAVLGVFCRRFGVPLIDGGTVRLPKIIGLGRALDLILTGRPVSADEALDIGLVNRVVDPGQALDAAKTLANQIAAFPQACMLADRASAYTCWDEPFPTALQAEFKRGVQVVESEGIYGAADFAAGKGRHGRF